MTRINEKLMSRVGPVYIKQIMPGLKGDLRNGKPKRSMSPEVTVLLFHEHMNIH